MRRHQRHAVAIAAAIAVAGLGAGPERDDSEEWEENCTGHAAAEHSLVEEAAEVVADRLAVGRIAADQEEVDSRAVVLDRSATW